MADYRLSKTGPRIDDILDNSARQDAIAIVSNGNTHIAINSGEYVYIKNHGTLSEGMYQATTNIAANAALSSSNVTGEQKGVANAQLRYKVIQMTESVFGTSFSPTSRRIGDTETLFGVPANKIAGFAFHNCSLTPAAIMIAGTYDTDLYLSGSQSTTMTYNANPTMTIVYRP